MFSNLPEIFIQPQGQPETIQTELIRTIREGQWRTVIITRDQNGRILNMFFPKDDLALRSDFDMAACELVYWAEQSPEVDPTKTIFGQLNVIEGQLKVISASDSASRPADPELATQLLTNYLNDTPELHD
jgi:hypothetical protein